MSDFSGSLHGLQGRPRKFELRALVLVLAPVVAILFQVYSPQFFGFLSFLDLPLLVTLYFGLTRKDPVKGVLIGAAIGLGQDAFSHNPLGLYGIVKTLVGFLGAYLSIRIDAESTPIRFGLAFGAYCGHQIVYWLLIHALLAQSLPLDLLQMIIFGLLNAAVAPPLFALLDKL